MAYNYKYADTRNINLNVLLDTVEKAKNLIQQFLDAHRDDLVYFSSQNPQRRVLFNSADIRKKYKCLMMFYQQTLVPHVSNKINEKVKEKLRKKWEKEGRDYVKKQDNFLAEVSMALDEEKLKEKSIPSSPYGRITDEMTRLSSADNIVKSGEVETNTPSGYGLGKATCGTCGTEKPDISNPPGWLARSWKSKGIPKIFFCSQNCLDKFDWNNYDPNPGSPPPKNKNCFFCQQQYQHGIFFVDNPGTVFCSERCARSWEREIWDKKNLADQRTHFITESLEKLSGWDLLTDEEKENFIRQVNSSKPEQFKNIFKQVKKLVSEKRKSEEDQTNGEGEENGENNSSDNSDTVIHPSNSGNNPDNTSNQEGKNNDIVNFPLVQSQAKSEQEIEKALKDSSISEAELDKELWGGKSNWKEFLKELDTPEKVAEFTDKMKQSILKKKMEKLASKTRTQDKKPKNDWILPVIMLSIFAFLVLILIIVIRKRKQKKF